MTAHRDLVVVQGTTWTVAWRFQTAGTPLVDHTWTARAQIRSARRAGSLLHEWSTAAANVTVDDQGVVTLIVAPATSSSWTWTSGYYDLELSKGNVTYRLVEGKVSLDPEVTQ